MLVLDAHQGLKTSLRFGHRNHQPVNARSHQARHPATRSALDLHPAETRPHCAPFNRRRQIAEDGWRQFDQAAGNDHPAQPADIQRPGDHRRRGFQRLHQPGSQTLLGHKLDQRRPVALGVGHGGREALQQAASGRQSLQTAYRAATAGPFVAQDGSMAQFAAHRQWVHVELACNNRRAANPLSEVHQQKVFLVRVCGFVPQGKGSFLLDQRHWRVPDCLD